MRHLELWRDGRRWLQDMPTMIQLAIANTKIPLSRRTVPSKTGTVARTARTKNKEIIFGPLLGSALKMWWISSNCPYLSGFSYFGRGALGSRVISRLNTWLLNGWEVLKEARRRVARRGCLEVSSWIGRSFWVCVAVSLLVPWLRGFTTYKVNFSFASIFH